LCYDPFMAQKRRKTGFDRYLEEQLGRPAFRKAYAQARADIEPTDVVVRALLGTLDAARDAQHLTKAQLARRMDTKPEVLRRLFTAEAANPTLSTVVKVASALGYKVQLVPTRPAKH
jgi:DNA-binding phage protein